MQSLAATLKGTDRVKEFLATLSPANDESGEEYHELTVEERIERAKKRHFITGEEELFAVCNADIFAACYHGDLCGVTMNLSHIKTPIKQLRKRVGSLISQLV